MWGSGPGRTLADQAPTRQTGPVPAETRSASSAAVSSMIKGPTDMLPDRTCGRQLSLLLPAVISFRLYALCSFHALASASETLSKEAFIRESHICTQLVLYDADIPVLVGFMHLGV